MGRLQPHSFPRTCGFPCTAQYRLAGQRVKDACGAATAAGLRPVPDPPPGSHDRAPARAKQP